jgi:hypothetical protein
MYRLGLRLTLRSGREPLVRLLVTAAAVAVGVAIMLAVLADFNAFRTTNNRPAWETTQGQAVTSMYPSARHAELWNYSNDIYQSRTIERLDVAALGPGAPVPPGISKLPSAGQYYASPALAALLRTVPAAQLGERFPGTLAGTIGQRALTGPDELVIYVGSAPAQLAARPATTLVTRIATLPGKQIWTHYFRDAFIVGAIAFLFPILILVGTATRLAAARREERYAALRLVGATIRQVAVISSVDAAVSAFLGALIGTGIFQAIQPALASSAITSARYFSDEVTPTAAGYLIVLIGVPVASAIAALVSLQRVRISPLGVSRRITPRPPSVWRIIPLLLGVALFLFGISTTNSKQIGGPAFPGLLVILIGLVVSGPWLTAQTARLLSRYAGGAAPMLAGRRLGDSPAVAFRAVSGLVLAVFLGTVVAGLLPAVEYITVTPRATALSKVLLDGFTESQVCGNNVNCAGGGTSGPRNHLAGSSALQQRIANEGLPPQSASALLAGLHAIRGATTVPIYSLHVRVPQGPVPARASGSPRSGQDGAPAAPAPGQPAPGRGGISQFSGPGTSVITCAGLRELAVLGECAPGRTAVVVPAGNLFNDNPQNSTQPIADASSPAARQRLAGLYLQAVLVKVNSPATLERVRTYLVVHDSRSAGGTAARTFGEAVIARASVATTVQRLVDTAVVLTLIVAGCSLAVTVGGSLVERKRPFTLLRVTGTSIGTLYRVVLLESVLPLAAATIVAGGLAYVVSVTAVDRLAPAGTPVPVPGSEYFTTMGVGLAGSLLVICASMPLLRRLTSAGGVRFE